MSEIHVTQTHEFINYSIQKYRAPIWAMHPFDPKITKTLLGSLKSGATVFGSQGSLFDEATDFAISALKDKAKKLNANAIIALTIQYTPTSNGFVMCIVNGMAVNISLISSVVESETKS